MDGRTTRRARGFTFTEAGVGSGLILVKVTVVTKADDRYTLAVSDSSGSCYSSPIESEIHMSNAVQLDFHWSTSQAVQAEVRANAVFIHAKLVTGGMDVVSARQAVEALFEAGVREGREDGYEDGRNQIAPLGDESYRD